MGITGYMVGAMDEAILTALAKRKIHTFSMAAGAGATGEGSGGAARRDCGPLPAAAEGTGRRVSSRAPTASNRGHMR